MANPELLLWIELRQPKGAPMDGPCQWRTFWSCSSLVRSGLTADSVVFSATFPALFKFSPPKEKRWPKEIKKISKSPSKLEENIKQANLDAHSSCTPFTSTGIRPPVAGCRLQVASCQSPVACFHFASLRRLVCFVVPICLKVSLGCR